MHVLMFGIWMILFNIFILTGILFPLQGVILGVLGIVTGILWVHYFIVVKPWHGWRLYRRVDNEDAV